MAQETTVSGSSRERAPDDDSSAGPAADSTVGHALTMMQRMVEEAISANRSQSSMAPATLVTPNLRSTRKIITQLATDARESILLTLPADSVDEEHADFLVHILGTVTADEVAVRALCTPPDLHGPRCWQQLEQAGPRIDIRITESRLQPMVLVDKRIALAWSQDGTTDGEAVLVRTPAVLRALHALFTETWKGATLPADYRQTADRTRTVRAQLVLDCLVSGRSDETAARELNMSLRTYRRCIAEIMQDLGANSRFQAGVKAVERGLLS